MWTPPPAPPRVSRERVKGALAGSLLYTRPEHAEKVTRLHTFLAAPGPVALEIGFDHGMCILDRARRFPAVRQIGLEIRARRVAAAAPHAPENCLLWHADARTVLASVLPEARLDTVYIWFPTPTAHGAHLLMTPELVEDIARVLRPGGVLHVKTDVAGYAAHLRTLLAGWPEGPPPLLGVELSRRERVCRRDGLEVVTFCVERP